MPEGTHWEWRGFGRISEGFRETFDCYPLKFKNAPAWDNTKDEYVWSRTSPVNVKLRSGGAQQGLKLKRFVDQNERAQVWDGRGGNRSRERQAGRQLSWRVPLHGRRGGEPLHGQHSSR